MRSFVGRNAVMRCIPVYKISDTLLPGSYWNLYKIVNSCVSSADVAETAPSYFYGLQENTVELHLSGLIGTASFGYPEIPDNWIFL